MILVTSYQQDEKKVYKLKVCVLLFKDKIHHMYKPGKTKSKS